ncbi:hypothetical protein HX109_15915 [Galbibacter sp. BG1]|uniref:hypothetical protein n=1 Tax=Galbibacter sp. BG1 TaxID=1170699 RepID=UPI0015BF44AA|nr:hypothetical protein [Galbibacter sp. BG1]QLE02981.1 hypothetical protein HX109_15915 [Galbibacter sp. BG1]
MKIIKNILKFLFVLAAVLAVISAVVYFVYNEPLPVGKEGKEAEALAQKMLKAINYTNYTKTRFIEWSVNNKHFYKWDKEKHRADVKWDENLVKLNLKNYSKSEVFIDGVKMHTEPREELIEKAVNYFNNDSFWLVAPFKIMDKGTVRKLVKLDNGEEALLVTYTQGGNTPGDSYLWKLKSNGFPESYKMWAQIIPIGGMEASWDDWKVTETTTYLPSKHKFLFFTLDMGDVKGYN